MNLKQYLEERVAVTSVDGDVAEVFKNPQTLKNMKEPWVRGIILANGDLYVMDHETGLVIHDDILKWLKNQGLVKNLEYVLELNQFESNIDKFFCVQRNGGNEFICGESYHTLFLIRNESQVLLYKSLMKKRGFKLLMREY